MDETVFFCGGAAPPVSLSAPPVEDKKSERVGGTTSQNKINSV